MPDFPFPLVAERPLPPATRKWFRGGRRDVAELPETGPGTVLVFEVDGRYEVAERRHPTGREPIVLDAVSVSLVDLRPRLVPVDLTVASASPADDFVFRVNFRCRVLAPETVAAAGLSDLRPFLRTHLEQDHILGALGANFGVDQLAIVRNEATARIFAYCEVRPPRVEGVEITLQTVEVFTPEPLREHEVRLRDERWNQVLSRLRLDGEQTAVEQVGELLATVESAQALAVHRGEMTSHEAAERAFAERADQRERLQGAIETLRESGHLDRVPVDAKIVVDSLIETITGRAPDTEPRLASPPLRQQLAEGVKDEAETGPRFIADEDHLVD